MFHGLLDKLSLLNVARNLWTVHVQLTRKVIVGVANESSTLMDDIKVLLKNQEDIGDVIKDKYGEKAGNELTRLLRDHINIAYEILRAAKEGENNLVEYQTKKWYQNGDDVAKFLSQLNVKWDYEKIRKIFYDHLRITLNEAVEQLHNDTRKSQLWYRAALNQILSMADVMSAGLVNQLALHTHHIINLLSYMF
jgi:hypothetical protein